MSLNINDVTPKPPPPTEAEQNAINEAMQRSGALFIKMVPAALLLIPILLASLAFSPFWTMLIFYMLGMALAIFLLVYSYKPMLTYHNIKKNWQPIKATIVSINNAYYAEYDEYLFEYIYPNIEYRYKISGSHYQSDKVAVELKDVIELKPAFNDLIGRFESLTTWWSKLSVGDEIEVLYNPTKPKQTIVNFPKKYKRYYHYLAAMTLGIITFSVILRVAWLSLT